jgi:hypothetical protein
MVESSGDSTRKKGLETNSGDVSPALARTACAEPLRPFKEVHHRSLKPPSRTLENSGTVPKLARETTAMNWAVGGGIERRFHPKVGFRDQFRRRLSRLGAHRMR